MDLARILNPLNDAQRAAVTAPLGPMLVLAGAGSGKTRVLTHRIAWLIQAQGVSPHSILAVTFTNKAAAEMRVRVEQLLGVPGSALWLGTFHGLAHRLLRLHWRDAGLAQGFQILDAEDQLRLIKKLFKANNLDESGFTPKDLQYFINKHKDEGRRPRELTASADTTAAQMTRFYAEYEQACARAGVIDFAELLLRCYELWRDHPALLEHYRSRFRHVLVDEFQDTNSVQYAWLRLLVGSTGALFVVGDDDQCLAAGTLVTMADGSKRAIESVRAGDQVMSSYGGGDLRSSMVTQCFARQRAGRLVCLHLRSGRILKCTPEHTHFAGYLLGEAPQTFFLYLMQKQGVGYRLGTSQVYTRGQAKPMVGFRQRALQEHADAVWIVRAHASANEARFDEMATSLRYGLPTLPFVARRGSSRNGLVHDPDYIGRLFRAVDTTDAALHLLEDVGLDVDRPHHVPRSRNSSRRNIVITLCADRRGRHPMHRISIVGNSAADRAVLEALSLRMRPAKNGRASSRYETVYADFGELMALARCIRDRLDGRYLLQGHMLERSLPFVTAAAIRPGMVMASEAGGFDIVERIEHEECEVQVFDLNIERTHNFIADGVITHNSIYRWRGARVENLQRFRSDFPQAGLYRLEQNYRSTGAILEAANALIGYNSGRLGKSLWTHGGRGEAVKLYAAFNERDEADFVVTRILEWVQRGGKRSDAAILYRSNAQSRAFEEALIVARVPYRVYGGLRFFERAEIKDALAYLRLMVNRDDDASFERIVNLPTRGIGAKALDAIREAARSGGVSLWQAATTAAADGSAGRATAAILGFLQLIEQLARAAAALPLHEQVDHVIQGSGLVEHYQKDRADRGEARVENLAELVSAARDYAPEGEVPPLQSFLAHAVLESGEAQGDAFEDCVQMMTLHSAKGLEFPLVFLCGLEEGLFPHQRTHIDLEGLEEERRLCYVGMTRAMKQLYFTYAEQRRLHGIDSFNSPSRFIREIPAALLEEVRPRIRLSQSHGDYDAMVSMRGSDSWRGADSRGRRGFGGGQGYHERSYDRSYDQAGGELLSGSRSRAATPGSDASGQFSALAERMRLGSRVRHGKFGEGIVLDIEGQGPHARVQVNFERQGSKWLMLQYANLELM
jgi:DNA helicase II / ATP-dependent DNA helicase PcrA